MFRQIASWVELVMFVTFIAISALIWIFKQFPQRPSPSPGQWGARIRQALDVVAIEGVGQAFHRAGLLAIGGAFLVMMLTQRVEGALCLALVYYLFGLPVFTALQVLRLADLPGDELSARLAASRAAQRASRGGQRDQ